MPHIVVDLPDPKADPMLKQLLRQFAAIQKQLASLKRPVAKDSSSKQVIQLVTRQQDALLRAIERMMSKVSSSSHGTTSMNGLNKRFNRLEEALRRVPARGFRNRTFGSNF